MEDIEAEVAAAFDPFTFGVKAATLALLECARFPTPAEVGVVLAGVKAEPLRAAFGGQRLRATPLRSHGVGPAAGPGRVR